MIEYNNNKHENKFTEDGHTMFEVDVLQRLKRLSYLENEITNGRLIGTPNTCGLKGNSCNNPSMKRNGTCRNCGGTISA